MLGPSRPPRGKRQAGGSTGCGSFNFLLQIYFLFFRFVIHERCRLVDGGDGRTRWKKKKARDRMWIVGLRLRAAGGGN